MIKPEDAQFHPSDPAEWRWTETTALIFSIPEHKLLANAYVAARPNLGVALSSIAIATGFCQQPFDMDFTDAQMHLPCPTDFTNYELPNGLRVEATRPPTEYRFHYEYQLGDSCSFDLTFTALHEPFDANDPAHNPALTAGAGEAVDERLGDEWGNRDTSVVYKAGHYEMMGRIEGELRLRGRTYAVDSYDVMDHSFGRRTETSKRAVAYVSAVFGPDYGIHIAVPLDVVDGETTFDGYRFGYVMEDGQLFGVTAAEMVDWSGTAMHTMNSHFVATDVRGKQHELFGGAIACHPWYSFNPSHVCFQTLMRWHSGDRVTYGEHGDIFGLEFLAERKSRLGRRRGKAALAGA
jgi:hypothetical protein